ncbi:MAG: hypothetical protein ACK5PQ_04870 [Alphaproteobacteria bacterium]
MISTLLLAGTAMASAVAEDMDGMTKLTIKERIAHARSLNELYTLAAKEQETRLDTWKKLKDGQDHDALDRAITSLADLKKWITLSCMELTGLKPGEKTERARVRQHFFDETSAEYKSFAEKIKGLSSSKTEAGSLSVKAGELYGQLVAQAGQRAAFYKDAFAMITSDTEMFSKEGFGAALNSWTGGYAESLEAALGKYFYAKNPALTLLMVPKEELESAHNIVSLMEKFHEPLGISKDSNPIYMASFGDEFVQKRNALEGSLSLSEMHSYIENKEFWEGTTPVDQTLNTVPTAASADKEEPTSSEGQEPPLSAEASSAVSTPEVESSQSRVEGPVVPKFLPAIGTLAQETVTSSAIPMGEAPASVSGAPAEMSAVEKSRDVPSISVSSVSSNSTPSSETLEDEPAADPVSDKQEPQANVQVSLPGATASSVSQQSSSAAQVVQSALYQLPQKDEGMQNPQGHGKKKNKNRHK